MAAPPPRATRAERAAAEGTASAGRVALEDPVQAAQPAAARLRGAWLQVAPVQADPVRVGRLRVGPVRATRLQMARLRVTLVRVTLEVQPGETAVRRAARP